VIQSKVLGRIKEPIMNEKIDLKEIRRQVYLFYSEDGLADLAVGLMIFGFGIFLLVDLPWLVGLLALIPFLVWYLGKQSLVVPRVGSIQPSQETKKRFQGFFAALVLMGIGVLVLYLVSRAGDRALSQSPLMIFGIVVGVGIASLGLVLGAQRFYIYGLIVFLAMAGGEALLSSIKGVDPFLVSVITAGALILTAGTIILVRFLNRYPVIELEG
jgi:hypothetical protein